MKALLAIDGDENEHELLLQMMKTYANELDQEAGEGSSQDASERPRRDRRYIHRDREGAGERLWADYFAEEPRYPANLFKRRFRMRSQLFLRIVQGMDNYSIDPLPEHFQFFKQKFDATGRLGFNTIQKCTSAIRQLAYGTSGDMFDEYLQMGESTSAMCLDYFCMCVLDLYTREYLRAPNAQDIERLYNAHEQRHGFRGMLGSLDCMHWVWKNCPTAWKGQYTGGHQGHPTVILEAVASYDLWIWHAYFGVAGSNNDINVLNRSPLFDSIKNGTAPPAPFTVNGHNYTNGYYLADGIYPDWATLIKSYSAPTDERRAKFKRYQESARKDVERAFGVLQGRFHVLKTPARVYDRNKLRRIMYTCIIMHNMIQEDNGYAISSLEEEMLADPANRPNFVRNRTRDRHYKDKEIRDRDLHNRLREDLTTHIWSLPPHFRTHN